MAIGVIEHCSRRTCRPASNDEVRPTRAPPGADEIDPVSLLRSNAVWRANLLQHTSAVRLVHAGATRVSCRQPIQVLQRRKMEFSCSRRRFEECSRTSRRSPKTEELPGAFCRGGRLGSNTSKATPSLGRLAAADQFNWRDQSKQRTASVLFALSGWSNTSVRLGSARSAAARMRLCHRRDLI